MNRLEKYIINNLSMLFLSIFSSLFLIASVIFLIKLATYTAIIQLTIWDMTKLYIFVIPELLFYTLPITFFVSAALTLFRLSNDNEIIVLFALGIHPKFILKTLLKPALILTALLLFDFFVLFPHTKVISKNFISQKQSEAKFNLSASEFGHKFGDWLLYIGKENSDKTYSDIFLFNKKGNEEILIEATKAEIINDSSILRLKLTDGEGYSYSKEKFSQINFETMLINNTFDSTLVEYKNPFNYWLEDQTVVFVRDDGKVFKTQEKENIYTFIRNIILSLFPIASLFIILSVSIIHARHQTSKIYLYLFLSFIIYHGSTIWSYKILMFYTIPIILISWLIGTYYIYKKTILTRF